MAHPPAAGLSIYISVSCAASRPVPVVSGLLAAERERRSARRAAARRDARNVRSGEKRRGAVGMGTAARGRARAAHHNTKSIN